MEYSAVSQPPETFCARIQPGTPSSTVAEQITRVSPKQTSTEPVAFGATLGWKEIGRSWALVRLSGRVMRGRVRAGWVKSNAKMGRAEYGEGDCIPFLHNSPNPLRRCKERDAIPFSILGCAFRIRALGRNERESPWSDGVTCMVP